MQTQGSIDPVYIQPGLLVAGVRRGDSAAVEELRRLLSRGVRFLAARKLPASQVDGCVREVLDHIVRGIQRGDLDDPLRLAQFVRMRLTAHIREIQHKPMPITPIESAPELNSVADESREIVQDLLLGLSPIERESLVRFYSQGHDDQRICRELRMPSADFRSLRASVKARFRKLCMRGGIGVAVR